MSKVFSVVCMSKVPSKLYTNFSPDIFTLTLVFAGFGYKVKASVNSVIPTIGRTSKTTVPGDVLTANWVSSVFDPSKICTVPKEKKSVSEQ